MLLLNKILKNEKSFLYLISSFYILTSIYLVIEKDFYYFGLFSILLLFSFIAIYSYDKFLMVVAFFTPFSLQISDIVGSKLNIDLSLPTEPLLILLTLIFIIKIFFKTKINIKLILHPVTLSILFSILWLLFTSVTSSMPVVSLKFVLARLWFVIPCFFLANQIFADYSKIKKFIWIYAISLSVIIIYTTINHLFENSFSKNAAHFVMQPFYNDHTAYGAIVALFIPVIFGLTFRSGSNFKMKVLIFPVLALLITGLILSYARAAWLSVLMVLLILLAVKLKIKFKNILITLGILLSIFFAFQYQILDKLEKNNQDSSDNLFEHIQSISNISTDASNVERLNRWDCAIKMFEEKPFFGWGPGTYMFKYAPYQNSKNKTIISTNFGEVGNAHSEYIGPLAETGIIGAISFIVIAIFTIITGIKNYRVAKNSEIKMISISVTLGLITYFLHGLLNNFLDTDKLSVPFWAFISIIVAIDIYHKNTENIKIEEIK